MTREQDLAIDSEIASMLDKGAIQEVPFSSDLFISRLFTVPKKTGGLRPVINLRPLNRCLFVPKFKMESLGMVRELVRPGDFFCKIDLTDAYFTVAIHPNHHRFLTFAWKNKFFSFVCLPFGVSSAPLVFTKLLKVVVSHLRRRGIRLIIYLDDMLIFADSSDRCRQDAITATDFIAHVGFVTNLGKSVLEPTQCITFLGSGLNSLSMCLFLPGVKLQELSQLAGEVLERECLSARQLASVIGKFQAATVSVLLGPLHLRHLQLLLISCLRQSGGFWQTPVRLTESARQDLIWWRDELRLHNYRPIHCPEENVVIETDASLDGWGAFANGVSTGGRWSRAERGQHINQLEMLAVFLALKAFCKDRANCTVRVKSDNSTVVSYINRRGGTRSPALSNLALSLWDYCVERSILLSADHVAGVTNVRADFRSRHFARTTEWSLCPQVFQAIQKMCPSLRRAGAVDLFASRLNRKLPKFVSWEPDPESLGTNAFTMNWNQWEALYAFPPFKIIERVLRKVRQDQVTVHFVAPIWDTAAWYPLILEMSVRKPVRLPRYPSLLTQPGDGSLHPLSSTLRMAMWTVSGVSSESSTFRKELQRSSSPPGVLRPEDSMRQRGGNGLAGAVLGVWIPFMHL